LSGLRRETLRARLEEAALQLAAADDEARDLYHELGKDEPETRLAQRRRRDARNRIAALGRSLRRRLDDEEEKRQEAEEREDQRERSTGA